jgi:hypothetical protein
MKVFVLGICMLFSICCWTQNVIAAQVCIRRFLMHVLPKGFHRIRHYGLFANGNRAANIAQARESLAVSARSEQPNTSEAAAIDEPHMLPPPVPLLRWTHVHHRDLRARM